jgi:hypothetical protein
VTRPNRIYRGAANEEASRRPERKVDQSLSNISARLAEIHQALGGLSTSVAVLTQRFDQLSPQHRAEANTSIR